MSTACCYEDRQMLQLEMERLLLQKVWCVRHIAV
jgi:hypothetical protein